MNSGVEKYLLSLWLVAISMIFLDFEEQSYYNYYFKIVLIHENIKQKLSLQVKIATQSFTYDGLCK